jgi:hypothetical protein
MLKLWYALTDQLGLYTADAPWLALIAKMLFWVIFKNYLETNSAQKDFAYFMGIELDE